VDSSSISSWWREASREERRCKVEYNISINLLNKIMFYINE
jgi:hypothetical protein